MDGDLHVGAFQVARPHEPGQLHLEALIYQHATEQRDREIAAYLDTALPEP